MSVLKSHHISTVQVTIIRLSSGDCSIIIFLSSSLSSYVCHRMPAIILSIIVGLSAYVCHHVCHRMSVVICMSFVYHHMSIICIICLSCVYQMSVIISLSSYVSSYVCQQMCVIICLSHVCLHMPVICLSAYVCHHTSINICLSLYVYVHDRSPEAELYQRKERGGHHFSDVTAECGSHHHSTKGPRRGRAD